LNLENDNFIQKLVHAILNKFESSSSKILLVSTPTHAKIEIQHSSSDSWSPRADQTKSITIGYNDLPCISKIELRDILAGFGYKCILSKADKNAKIDNRYDSNFLIYRAATSQIVKRNDNEVREGGACNYILRGPSQGYMDVSCHSCRLSAVTLNY